MKQTCGVSSVTLCLLLITHSLSVFVTHTQQVEPPDNQNQPGQARKSKGKVADGACNTMGSDVKRAVNKEKISTEKQAPDQFDI